MSASNRIHLMPIVMTAAAALLALKVVGLVTHTSAIFASPAAAAGAPAPEKGGHGAEPAKAPAPEARPAEAPTTPEVSASERGLLEALQKRRESLDARADDLVLRENLLKAAEKRMEERLAEMKSLEEKVSAAEDRRREDEKAKFREIITLYEGMKVKDAARIFDRLDPSVLIEVASRMNPRKLAEVMGLMSSEAAEKLTVAMARRSDGSLSARPMAANDLPQIVGRPSTP